MCVCVCVCVRERERDSLARMSLLSTYCRLTGGEGEDHKKFVVATEHFCLRCSKVGISAIFVMWLPSGINRNYTKDSVG